MTSLDEQLRELFQSAESPVDDLPAEVEPVRARVRRRRLRQRGAAVLAAAAAVVLVAGIVASQQDEEGSRVDTSSGGATTTTTPTDATTTTEVQRAPTPTSTPTTTSAPSTSSTELPPPRPSVRDIDFGSMTYPAPCPDLDGRPMTLVDGSGENAVEGASVLAELGPVSYADADGDGVEEALVIVECSFAGASSDNGLLAAVYRAGGDGRPEQVGNHLTLAHTRTPTVEGLSLTVDLDIYRPEDAACCPSEGARQVWRFDGAAFQLESSDEIAPPGATSAP